MFQLTACCHHVPGQMWSRAPTTPAQGSNNTFNIPMKPEPFKATLDEHIPRNNGPYFYEPQVQVRASSCLQGAFAASWDRLLWCLPCSSMLHVPMRFAGTTVVWCNHHNLSLDPGP